MIRLAKNSDIKEIKGIVDSVEQMDVIPETFSEVYYRRIIRKGIVIIDDENNEIRGVCFGTYNIKEKWADLLGLVVRREYRSKGIGTTLAREFESIARGKKLKTIDLYADQRQLDLFRKLKYKEGRTYTAFRKKL